MFEQIITVLKGIVTYIIPIIALVISILSYVQSSKTSKMEEKLKEYELKKIETENRRYANVEGKIVSGINTYKIRISNSGNIPAYQVDYTIPEKYHIKLFKDNGVTPLEILKPGNYFEEEIFISMGSSSKCEIITMWKDKDGNGYSNTELQALS